VLEWGGSLILIILKVAVGDIPIIFRKFFVVNYILVGVFWLGVCEILEEPFPISERILEMILQEHFENMRLCAHGIKCGSGLTIVKVGNCFQDLAIGVERLWLVSRLVPFGHVFGPLLSSFSHQVHALLKSLCKKTHKNIT
jgi:hypothetical protein